MKRLIIISIFILTTSKIFSHGAEDYTWTSISINSLYDFKNSKLLPSIDLNSAFLFVNAGVGYKSLDYLNKNGLTGYLGLGIGDLLEFQSGYSPSGWSFRFRSNIILGDVSEKLAKKHPYLSLTTFNLTAERYYKKDLKWLLGLGIGFSINTTDGIKHFKTEPINEN